LRILKILKCIQEIQQGKAAEDAENGGGQKGSKSVFFILHLAIDSTKELLFGGGDREEEFKKVTRSHTSNVCCLHFLSSEDYIWLLLHA